MNIVSTNQMRQLENTLINSCGMNELVLMENAGRSIADYIENNIFEDGLFDKKIVIVAGYGNNGGDGFVVARHLLNVGASVKIFVIGDEDKFSESSKVNYNILKYMDAPIFHIISERDWYRFQIVLNFSDIVVDALYGIGFHGRLSENYKKCIKYINQASTTVISIDIPSGLDSKTGMVSDICVRPDITLTLGLAKTGLFMHEGIEISGQIEVLDIGIPNKLIDSIENSNEYVDKFWASEHFSYRPVDVYKNKCGRILVIAGSTQYTGAAILSSLASLRAGAGMVRLAIPKSLYNVVTPRSVEQIVHPIEDDGKGHFTNNSLDEILDLISHVDIVLIGPGIGRDAETISLVRNLFIQIDKPIILDADALYAFSSEEDIWQKRINPTIITPHLGECSRLIGVDSVEISKDMLYFSRNLSEKINSTVVLKSSITTISYPNGKTFLCNQGHSGMATAGTGDVLSGIIAGLMGQDNIYDPVVMGVYMHSRSGLMIENDGIIASDIIDNLPYVFDELMKCEF